MTLMWVQNIREQRYLCGCYQDRYRVSDVCECSYSAGQVRVETPVSLYILLSPRGGIHSAKRPVAAVLVGWTVRMDSRFVTGPDVYGHWSVTNESSRVTNESSARHGDSQTAGIVPRAVFYLPYRPVCIQRLGSTYGRPRLCPQ